MGANPHLVFGATFPPFYVAVKMWVDSTLETPKPKSEIRDPQSEIGLHDIVRFFLTPARCGMFLSRARLGQMANELGMHLPFGSRFEVAEVLFEAAGESGQIAELLHALGVESEQWAAAYQALSADYPAWQLDRKSTRLNSSHSRASRMPSSA